MPRYDFVCAECGANFEQQLPFSSNQAEVVCPKGHHAVRRIYSSPQVVFKGSGWYITDHRQASPGATTSASAGE